MWYFYYDSSNGEFLFRSSKPYAFTTDPYITQPKTFNYGNYRVDLSTLEPVEKT